MTRWRIRLVPSLSRVAAFFVCEPFPFFVCERLLNLWITGPAFPTPPRLRASVPSRQAPHILGRPESDEPGSGSAQTDQPAPLAKGDPFACHGFSSQMTLGLAKCLLGFASMKNKTREKRAPAKPLQSGQVWQMEDSSLRVGLVGKTLVHYKHFNNQVKRSPVSLSSKDALQRFLLENDAVLIQEGEAPRPLP